MNEGAEEAAVTELANVQTAVIAGMVDVGVTTCTDTEGTFGPTDDFTISGTYVLSDYVLNGLDGVSGAYDIDGFGAVTVYSAPE